jgi:hypothetical protein
VWSDALANSECLVQNLPIVQRAELIEDSKTITLIIGQWPLKVIDQG